MNTKQERILSYIAKRQADTGVCPTLREIAQDVLNSQHWSSANYHVGKLKKAGLLARPYNTPRSLKIL